MQFLIAFALACALTRVTMGLAAHLGLVDPPGALKIHGAPVPVTGGIAVAAAALLVARPSAWIWIGALVALAGGMVDDARPYPPIARLVVQAIAGVALVIGGLTLEPLGALGKPALVLAVVGLCNGVNMLDGQDGLAGGLAVLASAGLAGVLATLELPAAGALALGGALLGFLVWNRPPARVFLGDGGAYAIAVLLTAVAAEASVSGWSALLAAGCCVGVFAYELCATIVRRVRAASTAIEGDREHSYDRLARRLGSRTAATGVMLCMGAVATGLGLLVVRAQPYTGVAVVAAAVIAAAVLDARLLPLVPKEDR